VWEKKFVIFTGLRSLYNVQPGDTLDSIAEKYSVDVNKIITYNIGLSPSKLEGRDVIIIPYAKPLTTSYYTAATLPDYPGYFAIPTTGWNWGELHNNNAVDIANSCELQSMLRLKDW